MAAPIIKVKNLKVFYNQGKPNEVRSLENVSVEVYPKEYVIIFGPSGCGKSTLLYSISGLQVPTEGEVEVLGQNLSKMKRKEKVSLHQSGIGMVFQAFYLIPSLTIIDNVCLPKVFRGDDRKTRISSGEKLLERFSIKQHAKKFPSQLSGGEKQRVSIARSLINDPGLILADEPVGNLDSESSQNVMNILRELNERDQKTVILVTHNPDHLHYADRVIYMRDGKVVKEEVNREKRPKEVLEKKGLGEGEGGSQLPVSGELKLLMRTFHSLSPEQIGALLTPYKADQLLSYILSDLNDEQVKAASEQVKKMLFKNIKVDDLNTELNKKLDKGGAGWNKLRAESFSERIKSIMSQSELLNGADSTVTAQKISAYLEDLFQLKLDEEKRKRIVAALKLRIEDKIDRMELKKKLDVSFAKGGVGLYRNTADKVSREMEMIKFIHYQA